MRNTDTNNTGPCRTMDIKMIDFENVPSYWEQWEKRKLQLHLQH